MQPSRSIQQAICYPGTKALGKSAGCGSTLLLSSCLRQPKLLLLLHNRLLQIRETKIRAYGLLREDHYTPEYVPNGVRWKNLLRRLLSPAACRKFAH
jgi:hypothetical protein